MTESLAAAIGRVTRDLDAHGVDLPQQGLDHVRRAIEPLQLESLGTDGPDELIEAHFAFMNARLDDVTTIVFSQAVADLFAADARAMKPAFARAHKNQFMTRIVLGRRLASRYFHEGRRRVDDEVLAESGVWLLRRCLRLSLDLVDRDDRAKPDVRRMMHSQIATSSAHVARAMSRDDEERIALLRSGLAHSLLAEANGDRSPDHDGYAIELALRLCEVTGEDTLTEVSAAIARARDVDSATSQGLVGDAEYALAVEALADRKIGRALPHLFAAVDHYDRAIALPRHERTADIGYHVAKRGRCYALLYQHGSDAGGRRDTAQLDRALVDWLDERSHPHRNDYETARLFLARARLAAARSDPAAAQTDLAAAARLLGDQALPQTAQQLEGQALGVVIESALDSGDVEAATAAVVSAAALAPETPAPAGQMAKAAMWLQGRLPRAAWEQLAEPILDRIEVDIVHPALTDSARGHVAGHAAGLARTLYLTAGADEASMLRAAELSRAHISTALTISAPALDGASRAAFEYARVRIGAGETASEDELGGWLDSLLWGISALRTEHTVQTTVESRFDVVACAVRVADSARRLLELTGDGSYAVTAADALAIAHDLAPDPRIEAARAGLAEAASAATLPTTGSAVDASAAAVARRRSHSAWRTLADADQLTGEAARQLRQAAAAQFYQLADDGDLVLGGKPRGGQRGVTSAQDPYGIAQQLVVLKRTDRSTAHREFAALIRLSDWLAAAEGPRGWIVPDPLGVVDLADEDAVCVMRRLPGHTLAHHAMEHLDGRAPSPQRMFDAAVDALGDFHTALWGGPVAHAEDVGASYLRAARQLTTTDDAARSASELEPVLDHGAQLPKKDAHAGNWLWSTAAGGLILVDIEGKSTRPVLLELATLIDDLPLLTLDEEGWDQRVEIARRYVTSLPAEARVTDEDLGPRLEACSLHVAVIGLARLRRRTWGASSRGIRFTRYQHQHYEALAAYLAGHATSDRVRRAAAVFTG